MITTWEEQFAAEWEAVTKELRKYKGLDKIPITTRHKDLRKRISDFYEDYRYGLYLILDKLHLDNRTFAYKCKGEVPFTEFEKKVLAKLLRMDEDEQKYYF